MRIRIEAGRDERRYAAAESYILSSRRSSGRLLALSPAVAGVLLLFGGRRAWVFAAALIAVGLLQATLVPWLQPRLGRWGPERGARHPHLLELHDGGVRCVSAGYDLDRPWSMFQRIVELPGQYLLIVGGRHYVSVPIDGLSEDQLADLRTLLDLRAPTTAA
jgi:YcxB-like protein